MIVRLLLKIESGYRWFLQYPLSKGEENVS